MNNKSEQDQVPSLDRAWANQNQKPFCFYFVIENGAHQPTSLKASYVSIISQFDRSSRTSHLNKNINIIWHSCCSRVKNLY